MNNNSQSTPLKKGPMPEANTFEEKFEILLKIYWK